MLWNVCKNGRVCKLLSPTLSLLKRNYHFTSNKFLPSYKKIEVLRTNAANIAKFTEVKRRYSNEGHRLPSLLYIQHPWKYLKTKLQFLRLKLFWDKSFIEKDFVFGTKQAVVVLTDLIRKQDALEISSLTTPLGFQQITRDMVLSRDDPRLKLVHFRREDVKKAIPVRVLFLERKDIARKHCIIDMFFVAMRNVNDFNSVQTAQLKEYLRHYEKINERHQPPTQFQDDLLRTANSSISRVIFAEIFTRFYREYTENVPADWFVSFYKIVSFDVLAFE